MSTPKVLTVTEINNKVHQIFKENFDKILTITGEISNLKTSGQNMYMTLKDNESSISAVVWSYEKKNVPDIQNGDKIIINGLITTYPKGGNYQINCLNIKLDGVGDLYANYVKLKQYYEKLGYFDKNKKKDLGKIKDICIITAIGSAAMEDILYVFKKNNFIGNLTLKSASVQGNTCPKSISESLREMDKLNFDLIIISRGGGSFEDLNGFNQKEVIEAIHCSKH